MDIEEEEKGKAKGEEGKVNEVDSLMQLSMQREEDRMEKIQLFFQKQK